MEAANSKDAKIMRAMLKPHIWKNRYWWSVKLREDTFLFWKLFHNLVRMPLVLYTDCKNKLLLLLLHSIQNVQSSVNLLPCRYIFSFLYCVCITTVMFGIRYLFVHLFLFVWIDYMHMCQMSALNFKLQVYIAH